MKLLRGLHNPPVPESGSVCTIGNFDGVHKGHQAILARVVEKAKDLGVPSLVLLFEPQPQEYFRGAEAPARLMTFRDKFECLRSLGIDYVCVLRFNEEFRGLSAQAFVDKVLIEHLKVQHLVIGDDFRFGGNREGDFSFLERAGLESGFGVERTSTVSVQASTPEDLRISSTLIREAVADGRLNDAERYLGRPYEISGRVMFGQQLGRKLGFPTANVALKRLKAPALGVFVVKVTVATGRHSGVYYGVANVGRKPSVGEHKANIEVHIFGFSADIYGQRVQIELLSKLRDEKRFDSVDALAEQIQQDNLAAQAFVAELHQSK